MNLRASIQRVLAPSIICLKGYLTFPLFYLTKLSYHASKKLV
ncbi:hypothetical protein NEOC65_001648 [Neochlamydia sp. AcF65]|nr:hypothetical protein [Neochlamydia sp. AcF65]